MFVRTSKKLDIQIYTKTDIDWPTRFYTTLRDLHMTSSFMVPHRLPASFTPTLTFSSPSHSDLWSIPHQPKLSWTNKLDDAARRPAAHFIFCLPAGYLTSTRRASFKRFAEYLVPRIDVTSRMRNILTRLFSSEDSLEDVHLVWSICENCTNCQLYYFNYFFSVRMQYNINICFNFQEIKF